MASFLHVLETIGKDVGKGVAVTLPIVGKILGVADPPAAVMLGPILAEITTVINALESSQGSQTLTPEELSIIIQAVATTSALKSAAASAATSVISGSVVKST